jgi:hypothetical protein
VGNGNNENTSPPPVRFNLHTNQHEQPSHQHDLSPNHHEPQEMHHDIPAMAPTHAFVDEFRRISTHHHQGNRDEVEHPAFSTHPLQSEPVEGPGSAPSDRMAGLYGGNNNESIFSNPPSHGVGGPGEESGSHGTLMLSKGGRSRYLGPTAGSEWLKDVSNQSLPALDTI